MASHAPDHQPKSPADDSVSQHYNNESNNSSEQRSPNHQHENPTDLDTLFKALDDSVNLVELKSQKAVALYHLVVAETKLSVKAILQSAFMIASLAGLACLLWILINVTVVVFINEYYSSIYLGLVISLGLHMVAILFCYLRLQQLKKLIGFNRVQKLMESTNG